MNRTFFSAAALALAVLSAPALAHPITYVGTFSTAGEGVPASGPSAGTGSVTVIFDDDTFTMSVQASFSGLSGTVTAAHMHCCTAVAGTGNAGVATPTPTFPSFPLGATFGTYNMLFDMTQASSWNPSFVTANTNITGAFAALSTGLADGKVYFNIHTTAVSSGEIRGFLAPVPEPESYALMLAGLGVLGMLARRRNRG